MLNQSVRQIERAMNFGILFQSGEGIENSRVKQAIYDWILHQPQDVQSQI